MLDFDIDVLLVDLRQVEKSILEELLLEWPHVGYVEDVVFAWLQVLSVVAEALLVWEDLEFEVRDISLLVDTREETGLCLDVHYQD